MPPRVLFIIEGDPRKSPRPAEAFRIAAGVAAWKKVEVSVYLRGAAILALSEFADELIDEDNFTRFLPILAESGKSIYVQKNSPYLGELGEPAAKFQTISDTQLADLTAQQTCVTRFADEFSNPNPMIDREDSHTAAAQILCVQTRPGDPLAAAVTRGLKNAVACIPLTGSKPDYNALLDMLFETSSVQVW